MFRIITFLFCLFLCSGCATVKHLDELMTLKELSEGQAEIDAFVEERDQKFKLLVEAVRSKDIKNYSNQQQIYADFGEPVYSEVLGDGSYTTTLWVYRKVTEHFNTDKINLYFDGQGLLKMWEFDEADSKKE